MSSGTLDFSLTKPDFLNFGRTATPANELTLLATLEPISATLSFFLGVRLRIGWIAPWQIAQPGRRNISLAGQDGTPQPCVASLESTIAQPAPTTVSLQDSVALPTPIQSSLVWKNAWALQTPTSVRWQAATILKTIDALPWDTGGKQTVVSSVRWQAGAAIRNPVSVRYFAGTITRITMGVLNQHGQPLLNDIRVLWDHGRPPPHGYRASILPNPLAGKQWGRLNFVCPAGGTLNFGNACFGSGQLLVAIQRSYRVINSAALIRVSDSADIPVSSLTIGLDWESWCWTLSATLLGRTAYETVPASPGLVQATINGFVWQFIVDDADYSRSFGSFGGTLSARSPIAALAEPYALAKSYREASLKTAQQLTLQELTAGFSLSTTLPDWTVPAGTFQYEDLTNIEAIIRITQACGGRVIADKVDKIVYVAPKWPRKPWNWNTEAADVTLPSSYTLKEALKQKTGYEYEAVMVSGGVNNGIVAICKRTGTGGVSYAPSVVDTLITHLDAATPRAIQELADNWPMKAYTLELPLQATPAGAGLIEPGTVIDFADGEDDGWRGLVIGITITATRDSVRQNLEIIAP